MVFVLKFIKVICNMLSIKEVIEATNGKNINGDINLIPKNYVLDSREAKSGDFFIPVVGEKVDSHVYILDCVKNGIIGYFINSNFENKENVINESLKLNKNVIIIEVDNAQNALYNAAKYNREKHLDIPVIAVTGSVGKTSTREMIASILKEEKNILVTEKNYNSCIGIPLMVLKMESQDMCVFESGIDRFGEMELESRLLKPDVAVITNIGTAHIGTFGNKETTFGEKIQITNYIKGIKTLIVNDDDFLLNKVESNDKYYVLKYSIKQAKEVVIGQESTKFKTIIYKKECEININQIGRHNIYNVLCAIKVAELFNISTRNILKGIENYKNFVRRMEKKYVGDNILIIDDTYNASIDSMKSGLETVNVLDGKRKIAVLGDMFDLGEHSKEIHLELGKIFSKLKYDILLTLGDASKNIAKSASRKVKIIKSFEGREELIKEITSILKSGDVAYFKASNGMKFNEVISEIEKFYNK